MVVVVDPDFLRCYPVDESDDDSSFSYDRCCCCFDSYVPSLCTTLCIYINVCIYIYIRSMGGFTVHTMEDRTHQQLLLLLSLLLRCCDVGGDPILSIVSHLFYLDTRSL